MKHSGASRILMVFAALQLMSPGTAADFTNTSAPFSVAPGETAFGVTLPRFQPSAHPEAPVLAGVQFVLLVKRSADVALFAAAPEIWTAGTVAVSATPAASTNFPILGPVRLGLSGTNSILDAPLTLLSPQASASAILGAPSLGPDFSPWLGADEIGFDIDAAIDDASVLNPSNAGAGLIANDLITGWLQVVYSAAPPPVTLGIATQAGAVLLYVMGSPSQSVQIESATGSTGGPWFAFHLVTLDGQGRANVVIEPAAVSVEFFRARAP
jgi:hypothetical protein